MIDIDKIVDGLVAQADARKRRGKRSAPASLPGKHNKRNKRNPEHDNDALDAAVADFDRTCGARLLGDVYAFLGRFVAYPSEHAHVAHTLWIAHTHGMEAWESTPRIAFLSPEPSSGKTRALEITETMVPRPVEAVNVSPSYLFRKVAAEAGAPTILFDEIDTVFGPKAKENEEIRGLLNAGHRRGAVAGRCVVRGNQVATEEIPAYCAVALAGLGDLPDTILTRSVIIRMRRRAPDEKVAAYRRRVHAAQGEAIRDELAQWVASVRRDLTNAWPEMPDGVEDRNADVWEALLAIADAAGGEWPERARVAAVTLVMSAREADPSLGIRLLGDIRTVFGEHDVMATEAILSALHGLDEAPWGDLRGKPLNDRGLATRLRKYGIKPKVVRIGSTTARGYSREDMHDAWLRYLGPYPASVTSVPSETEATCHHCGGNGELLEVHHEQGADPALLHRGCIDAFTRGAPQ